MELKFAQRGFTLHRMANREQALDFLRERTRDKVVACGGSVTLQQLDVEQALDGVAKELHWHWSTPGQFCQTPAVYLTSANALAESGEIVNIDGTGNRVSATLFGCEEVYFVCGRNKLAPDLAAAIDRARNIAAPKNAQRLGAATPCAKEGDRCYGCRISNPKSICRALVVLEQKPLSVKKMEILLLDEVLGY